MYFAVGFVVVVVVVVVATLVVPTLLRHPLSKADAEEYPYALAVSSALAVS